MRYLDNFLISDPVDEEWVSADEEGGDDLEPETVSVNTDAPDYSRRDELFYYLSKLPETSIN